MSQLKKFDERETGAARGEISAVLWRTVWATGNYFDFRPSSTFGPRAADDALLLRLQRTGVRSNRRGHVGGLDQQER